MIHNYIALAITQIRIIETNKNKIIDELFVNDSKIQILNSIIILIYIIILISISILISIYYGSKNS